MTATTVCFVSSKGGSGKTVTCAAMGTFLASLGFKVLLVDTDAATNGMTLLFLEQLLGVKKNKSGEEAEGKGLFDVLPPEMPKVVVVDEKLHFVPATYSMLDTEAVGADLFDVALTTVLGWRRDYDFILLDAQAGADSFARSAALHSDQCIIVSEYDPISAQGIDRLKILFGSILGPTRTWTLFNKVLPEFASVIGQGLSVARYLTPIAWDADVVRAFARRDLAIDMRAPNAYTISIAQIVLELFPDETWTTVEKWRGRAIEENVSPVKQRIAELSSVIAERDKRPLLIRIIPNGGFPLGIAGMLFVLLGMQKKWIPEGGPDRFVVWAAIAAIILCLFAAVIEIFDARWKRRASQTRQAWQENIEEYEKLKASLSASEALMRFEGGGFYSQRRRAPSRDLPVERKS